MITRGLAHLITGGIAPEILIADSEDRTGTTGDIASYALEVASLDGAIDVLTKTHGWTMTGPLVTIQAGYAVVSVEREA